jgi:hypothetical protein
MLTRFLNNLVTQQERKLGAPLDYLREIVELSPSAFFKLALIGPMGTHRKRLPLDAFHVARIAATKAEDCGTCVQIAVNVAQQEGISPDTLDVALDGNTALLSDELATVYRLAETVARGNDDPELREAVIKAYGKEALVELAFAIASSRLFPAIKRTLGHAQSCLLVKPAVRQEQKPVKPMKKSRRAEPVVCP